ncbi:TonB-dependent receptor domain-containing protein [Alishewanella longhuensis]
MSRRANALPEKYADNIRANCAAQGIPTTFEPSEDWFSSTRPGFIVGNTDLKNEVAKDITIGFVYTPDFIENLSLTVDYWKFDIDNMINSFTGTALVTLCYQSDSLDNPYCPLIERDPETKEIVNYFEKPVNSAVSRTSGFDIEANYRIDTELGNFGFRLISTYLQERMYNSTGRPDDEVTNTGEVLRPKWKHRWTTDYTYDGFSAALTMTHRSATVLSNTWSPNVNNYNDVSSYTTFDLTTRYNVTDNLQVRAGVLNMFDRDPPRQPGVFAEGAAFDVIGRRLTAGVKYDF